MQNVNKKMTPEGANGQKQFITRPIILQDIDWCFSCDEAVKGVVKEKREYHPELSEFGYTPYETYYETLCPYCDREVDKADHCEMCGSPISPYSGETLCCVCDKNVRDAVRMAIEYLSDDYDRDDIINGLREVLFEME